MRLEEEPVLVRREPPEHVDIAVLGGGINGAGIACLAASHGYRVALFEKGDFASGTTSRSSKLIHGGIRYLETGHFGLVRDSLREREALLRSKPHLVKPLQFLLPSYVGDSRAPWLLRAGLLLYDWLSTTSSVPRPQWLTTTAALDCAASLRHDGLRGAGSYFDAQVDDARLTLEEILDAQARGATCLNYCEVVEVAARPGSCNVSFRDLIRGEQGVVRARAVVVAAGPWTDMLRQRLTGTRAKLLRPTRGTHVVLREPLANAAVVGAAPQDGRVFFAIPWQGMGLVGTTDDDDVTNPDLVAPEARDVDYLLEAARHYFPGKKLSREDVVSSFAGLRPLLADGATTASAVSRDARVVREGRIFFVVGGKLTTYRALARKALGHVLELLHEPQGARPLLHDWDAPPAPRVRREVWAARLQAIGVSAGRAKSLAEKHGERVSKLLQIISDEPALSLPLCPAHPELRGEVAFAVLHEGAHTLEDVLLRRLSLGHRCDLGPEATTDAASILGRYAGGDGARQRE